MPNSSIQSILHLSIHLFYLQESFCFDTIYSAQLPKVGFFERRRQYVSLRADEIKLWLTPSAKQGRNPRSGLPAVYPDLSTRHDWPVKKGLCFVCRDRQSG